MGAPAEELRITLQLDFDDVRWPQVLDLLTTRYRLTFREANEILKDFHSRFLKPFNLYWFTRPRLSKMDNKLLTAICETHGADVIVLNYHKPYRMGALSLNYTQTTEFEPNLRTTDSTTSGSQRSQLRISLWGRTFDLKTLKAALCFFTLLCIAGVGFYVVTMGALLYALAVFLLFIEQPYGVTRVATEDAAIGLALLCFLVASSAIFGRAIANVSRLAYQKLKPQK